MRLVLIVEDRVGVVTAKTLANRVLIECGPDWVGDSIDSLCEWTGLDADTPFTKWIELMRHPASFQVKVQGYRRDDSPDNLQARRALALALLVAKDAPLDAVVLVRDMDNQPGRRGGLDSARDAMAAHLPFQVLIAAADPEGEAWILHGFCPRTDAERERLAGVRRRLGLDPTLQPERLRGDRRRDLRAAERDIKRVLSELSESDRDREQRGLESTPLRVLMERGGTTGLADFLVEVRTRLLPLLAPGPLQPCEALME